MSNLQQAINQMLSDEQFRQELVENPFTDSDSPNAPKPPTAENLVAFEVASNVNSRISISCCGVGFFTS